MRKEGLFNDEAEHAASRRKTQQEKVGHIDLGETQRVPSRVSHLRGT